jgi:BMFP domain-containing protein YqiC
MQDMPYGLAFTINQQAIALAQANDEIARLEARVAELEAAQRGSVQP